MSEGDKGITAAGRERLEGITTDIGDMPDMVPMLAMVAALAKG